jgi:hypothetical protein
MDQSTGKTQSFPYRIEAKKRRRHDRRRKAFTFLWEAVVILMLSSPSCDFTFAYAPRISFLSKQPYATATKNRINTNTCFMTQNLAADGLSRYYQGILSRTNQRQRFVTGGCPLIVTVEDSPTRKWLSLGRSEGTGGATSLVLVNDTTIDRSLASYDRFQWLDEEEREELHNRYTSVSLELLAEIHVSKPGYVHILPSDGAGVSAATLRNLESTTSWNQWRNSALYEKLEDIQWNAPYRDRLWVTGFSLAGRKGFVNSVDVSTGHIDSVNARSEAMTLWPNEVNSIPTTLVTDHSNKAQGGTTIVNNMNGLDDALLVSDGFLVPGKDRGGIYVIRNPSNPNSEWTTCLTNTRGSRWFYHR